MSVDNATPAEAGGVATVTATLSAVSTQTVTVDLGFSGTAANINDYTRSATQVVIPAGSTTGSITLTAVQDTLDETAETIVADITSVTNGVESGIQQVTATIDDDDPAPDVVLSLVDSPLPEAGGVATMTATLSAASSQTVTVDLGFSGTAIHNSDYTRSNTQIVIPAGSTTGSITLVAIQDTLNEADETIVVDIASVTNGIESGTQQVTVIIDNEDQIDFGDAPDTGAGNGNGNYETLLVSDGPSHAIVTELFLGTTIDADSGTLQNVVANADDVDGALLDDEDGVLNPLDLLGTVAAAPAVTLLATNMTGSVATLSGWIDYNQNGVFDNVTERAQIAVPDGSNGDRFTLAFPVIPPGSAGQTYARFRLSTDSASENSTGAASDGEVEDYRFRVDSVAQSPLIVDSLLKFPSMVNGGPSPGAGDLFGSAVTSLGDLNGDGIDDLAVGAFGNDTGGNARGVVNILFMSNGGSVNSFTTIAHETNGGPALSNNDFFGRSISSLGDLNGDGVTDLAVGAEGDDTGGGGRGAVHILLLNSDGGVQRSTKIASDTNGGPTERRQFFWFLACHDRRSQRRWCC